MFVSTATIVMTIAGAVAGAVSAQAGKGEADKGISVGQMMAALEKHAGVAKELAIARRIEMSEEVIYEEYYEDSNSGKVGVSVSKKGGEAGVSLEKVVKRVFTFKGFNDAQPSTESDEILKQVLAKLGNSEVLTDDKVTIASDEKKPALKVPPKPAASKKPPKAKASPKDEYMKIVKGK